VRAAPAGFNAAQTLIVPSASPDVRDIVVQIEREWPLADVARELAEAAGLTPPEWQTLSLLLNPPGLAPLALALVAELHGRCGHFPALVNIRPVAGAVPPRYEVAEIVNLQALRDTARTTRGTPE
jgi:hypothetical protein